MPLMVSQRKPSYYFYFGLIGVAAAVIGFSMTFFLPISQGTFEAPPIIHVHGAFAFSWILLFLLQVVLIKNGGMATHRRLGLLALLVAAGTAITMVPAGLFQVGKDLQTGLGDTAYSGIVGTVTSGIMFFALVAAALICRRRPDLHKRLMLLATVVVLWPAWFRFRHYFPSVPRPDFWFGFVLADIFIVIAWIGEWMRSRTIHPVLLYGGLSVMLEQGLELVAFDTPAWRSLAMLIYGALQ